VRVHAGLNEEEETSSREVDETKRKRINPKLTWWSLVVIFKNSIWYW